MLLPSPRMTSGTPTLRARSRSNFAKWRTRSALGSRREPGADLLDVTLRTTQAVI
jgi:hypothetical protein